jgi:hypothetical protein
LYATSAIFLNTGKEVKMDDKTENQQATANSNNGDKSTGFELIDRARSEREGLAKENERLEKNIKELRELEAQRLLGSTAGGRVESPQLTENDLKKKEAVDFWKGTSIADAIVKHG